MYKIGLSRLCLILATVIVLFVGLCEGSEGDRQPGYQRCVNLCLKSRNNERALYTGPKDLFLEVMLWSNEDDCRYVCQQEDAERRSKLNLPVVQYHGKWPFKRVLGMQELFSVVFSLGNAAPHLLRLTNSRMRNAYAPSGYSLRPVLLGASAIGVNTCK